MNIEANSTRFAPNVKVPREQQTIDSEYSQGDSRVAGSAALAAGLGTLLAGCFYAVVCTVSYAPLERYFLGHPVAIAATVLFWFALAVLISKWLGIAAQLNQLTAIRDEDLRPPSPDVTPAKRWLHEHDAGHVARGWIAEIARLPAETKNSHLVSRLYELLTRQSQRGTAKHLADDLRELSARDADAAHDSLGLVRIIVWAIPMLGFLGTVIGITQTLGGLDFANGSAAVQNLKSGLYVAFDTTALGLVLSVVAIFLQFPIERSEQRLLAEIDARVGHLVSASLPSDDASDNQTALIADLCQGVQAAVAESLDNQARLWRETIDEAQQHWQSMHQENHNRIAEAFENTLVPALTQHAQSLADSADVAGDRLEVQCDRWSEMLQKAQLFAERTNSKAADALANSLETVLQPALQDHACCLDEAAQLSADRLERQWERWQSSMTHHSDTLSSQQLSLLNQYEALIQIHQQSGSLLSMQQGLDQNLLRIAEINGSIDRSISAAAGDGMADAMRILARAVDVLSKRLAESNPPQQHTSTRRAA